MEWKEAKGFLEKERQRVVINAALNRVEELERQLAEAQKQNAMLDHAMRQEAVAAVDARDKARGAEAALATERAARAGLERLHVQVKRFEREISNLPGCTCDDYAAHSICPVCRAAAERKAPAQPNHPFKRCDLIPPCPSGVCHDVQGHGDRCGRPESEHHGAKSPAVLDYGKLVAQPAAPVQPVCRCGHGKSSHVPECDLCGSCLSWREVRNG